jgi:hypothetical protein
MWGMPQSWLKFDAAHWHERAREMRALAEKASDEEAGRRMLRIAADYEKLAERAEAANKETPGR